MRLPILIGKTGYLQARVSLGTVRERVGNGRQYIIEWADQTVQLQVK